jgi:hypothetical protein
LCQNDDIVSWGNREVAGDEVRQVGWVEGGSHIVFSKKKIPDEKGSVRRCIVIMQQLFFFVTKVLSEIFAHFEALAIKHHSRMWN